MTASATHLPAAVRSAVEDRHWLSSDHCADPVLELLHSLGWAVVDTPQANVHATSPDGRVYVGWLPEDPTAWKRGIVWQVQVQPTEGEPWVQGVRPPHPLRSRRRIPHRAHRHPQPLTALPPPSQKAPLAHRAPLTNHHADGTLCPADHKHTSSGKPLHPDCPGRAYTQAVCSCGEWEMKQPGKGYVNESRKRHLASHTQGPKALRDLLRLDGF